MPSPIDQVVRKGAIGPTAMQGHDPLLPPSSVGPALALGEEWRETPARLRFGPEEGPISFKRA
jgi:hypothetical protein